MDYYGIDPGKAGGVAKVDQAGDLVFALPMPQRPDGWMDVRALHDMIDFDADSHYAVERAQPMPRQGMSSTAKYMTDYGKILGLIESRIEPQRVHLPRPLHWKPILETGRDKKAAAELVEVLHPDFELVLPGRRVPHDGIADAICIAHWCRTTH